MGTGCEIRRQLTIAATKAKPIATYIQTGILSVAEVTLKIKATNVVPSVCPNSRAVPCIPFAPHSGNEGRPISSCYYSGSGTGRNPYRKASIAKRYPYWWVAPAIKPIEEVRSHTPPFRYRLTIRDDISRSASRLPERSRSSLPAKESTAAPSPPHFFRPHFAIKGNDTTPTTVP